MPPNPQGTDLTTSSSGRICILLLLSIALPDPPEDILYNTDFPQFKGQNIARGWDTLYEDYTIGEDGLTRKEREQKEEQVAFDKRMDAIIQAQFDNVELLGINVRQFPDEPCAEEISRAILGDRTEKQKQAKPKTETGVLTIKSRNAAAALSQQRKPTVPANPKIRTQARIGFPSIPNLQKKSTAPNNSSSMRHAAATAGSKTTLGYSKGRTVRSTMREKPSKSDTNQPRCKDILSPAAYMELHGTPPFGSEMWSRCKAAGCFDTDLGETEDYQKALLHCFEEDELAQNFQLTL
jgi:hypothetical protein